MALNILIILKIRIINKKLINKIKNNKEIINLIKLEFAGLNLEINLEKNLFYIKYKNISNKFFNFLNKRRKIKTIK